MKLKHTGMIAFMIMNASLFAIPTLANAEDFNISNQTKYELSFYVNGFCAKNFGSVPYYSIKSVSEKDFMNACKDNLSPCEVVVYDSKFCQGLPIATVKYYIPQNRVELYGHSAHNLGMAVSGYNLFFVEPMPLQKNK